MTTSIFFWINAVRLALLFGLLVWLLQGCGCDTDSRYGVCLYDETDSVSIEEVDAAVDRVLDVIGGKGKRLDGMKLSVEEHVLLCKSESGQCAGLSYLDQQLIRVWHHDPTCFARSSFTHELIHFFELWRDGLDPVDHSDPKWWDAAGGAESVEAIAYSRGVCEECPE